LAGLTAKVLGVLELGASTPPPLVCLYNLFIQFAYTDGWQGFKLSEPPWGSFTL